MNKSKDCWILLLASLLLAVGCTNLHQVNAAHESPAMFRSGQMSPSQLEETINEYGIDVVVNLRGASPDKTWYQNEVASCFKMGAEHKSVKLSAWKRPRKKELLKLIDILEDVKRRKQRVLVHCQGGADRASFASTLGRMILYDTPVKDAMEEYWLFYGHLCGGDCDPENVWHSYAHHEDVMTFKAWVEQYYRRE